MRHVGRSCNSQGHRTLFTNLFAPVFLASTTQTTITIWDCLPISRGAKCYGLVSRQSASQHGGSGTSAAESQADLQGTNPPLLSGWIPVHSHLVVIVTKSGLIEPPILQSMNDRHTSWATDALDRKNLMKTNTLHRFGQNIVEDFFQSWDAPKVSQFWPAGGVEWNQTVIGILPLGCTNSDGNQANSRWDISPKSKPGAGHQYLKTLWHHVSA